MKLFQLEFRISYIMHYSLATMQILGKVDTRMLPWRPTNCIASMWQLSWCILVWRAHVCLTAGPFVAASALRAQRSPLTVDCNIVKANMISYILITLTFYVNISEIISSSQELLSDFHHVDVMGFSGISS